VPVTDDATLARCLVDQGGRTYAESAGITLADRPRPLYQLLVLAELLSTRIRAGMAVAAARELFAAGGATPSGMERLSWQQRVDALGRAHYRRYDESTATRLGEGAVLCRQRWRGDLRRLHAEAGADPVALRRLLTGFPGIGPTGADIFLREVQRVWTDLRPFADRRVLSGARRVGLPADARALRELVSAGQFDRLVAALIRVDLGDLAPDACVQPAR